MNYRYTARDYIEGRRDEAHGGLNRNETNSFVNHTVTVSGDKTPYLLFDWHNRNGLTSYAVNYIFLDRWLSIVSDDLGCWTLKSPDEQNMLMHFRNSPNLSEEISWLQNPPANLYEADSNLWDTAFEDWYETHRPPTKIKHTIIDIHSKSFDADYKTNCLGNETLRKYFDGESWVLREAACLIDVLNPNFIKVLEGLQMIIRQLRR